MAFLERQVSDKHRSFNTLQYNYYNVQNVLNICHVECTVKDILDNKPTLLFIYMQYLVNFTTSRLKLNVENRNSTYSTYP